MNCHCCGRRVVLRKRSHRWWVLCPLSLQQGKGLAKVLQGPCYSRGQAEKEYRMKLFRRAADAAGLPL